MTTAAVLAIGDELIAGRYPDLNSGTISVVVSETHARMPSVRVLPVVLRPIALTP